MLKESITVFIILLGIGFYRNRKYLKKYFKEYWQDLKYAWKGK